MKVNAERATQLTLWYMQHNVAEPVRAQIEHALDSAGQLDLSPVAVREVPSFLHTVPALDSLTVRFAANEHIEIDVGTLPRLRRLSIVDSEIYSMRMHCTTKRERRNEIEAFELSGCVTLQELKLSGCAFETARVGDVPRLQALEVSDCRLRGLVVTAAPRLECLDASMNRLGDDSLELCGVEQLATVNLARGGLSKIPSALSRLSALRELYLQANRISHTGSQDLPAELASLDLSNNCLTTVPFNLACAATLRDLKLDMNQIDFVTDAIGSCRRLETLDLSHNRIRALPTSIGRCTLLRRLKLESNQLMWLAQEICDLPALEMLRLDHNKLLALPDDMFRLTRLTSLQVQRNGLTTLPARLDEVPLRRLNLRGNPLLSVPEPLLRKHTQAGQRSFDALIALDLGHTCLAEVPPGLGYRHRLVQLGLYGNKHLRSLPADLPRLTRLNRLDLTHCGFRRLPQCLARMMPGTEVSMRWNPLDQQVRRRIEAWAGERNDGAWVTIGERPVLAPVTEEVRVWQEQFGGNMSPKSESSWNAFIPFKSARAFVDVIAGVRTGTEFIRSSSAGQTRLWFGMNRMLLEIEAYPDLGGYIFDDADLIATTMMNRYHHAFDRLALTTRLHAMARVGSAQGRVAASLMREALWRDGVAKIAAREMRGERIEREVMADLAYRTRLPRGPAGFPFGHGVQLDALAMPLSDARVAQVVAALQLAEDTGLATNMVRSPIWRRYLTRAFSGEYLALIAPFEDHLDGCADMTDAAAARDAVLMQRDEVVYDWLRQTTIALLADNPLIEPPHG